MLYIVVRETFGFNIPKVALMMMINPYLDQKAAASF